MINETISKKIEIFNNLLNNQDRSQKNINDMMKYLKDFCCTGLKVEIKAESRIICMFCKITISSEFKRIIACDICLATAHLSCIKQRILFENPLLDKNKLQKLTCFCNTPINQTIKLSSIFTPSELSKITEKKERKRILELEEEEKKNEILFKKFIEQEKEYQRTKERNYTFVCGICEEEYKVEEDCITLDCNHRFDSDCLKKFLHSQIENNKCDESDLICVLCKYPISFPIIEKNIDKDYLEKYDKNRLMYNHKGLIKENEIAIRCQKADCIDINIMDKNEKIIHHTCKLCNTEYCVWGCAKTHKPLTCEQNKKKIEEERRIEEEKRLAEIRRLEEEQRKREELARQEELRRLAEIERIKEEENRKLEMIRLEALRKAEEERRILEQKRIEEEKRKYDAWKVENDLADEKFNLFVQNDKLRQCSKCKHYIQKNQGCNHITCRCRHEFCYVCGGNWRPKTCGH